VVRLEYRNFLERYTCYELIPESSKMIVFDSQLLVRKAFFALLKNEIRSAPVWDHKVQSFVGMVTVTDYINILRKYHDEPEELGRQLDTNKIQDWRENLGLSPRMINIGPKDDLYVAVSTLLSNKIHRLPVLDRQTGNPLFIITHKRVLSFIHQHFAASGLAALDFTLEELNLGSIRRCGEVHTATMETKLLDILNTFVEKGVSAVPIVNSEDVVTGVYAKFDVITLARERTYNDLNVPLSKALETSAHTQKSEKDGVHTCSLKDSFRSVIDKIVRARVHRLIVTDDDKRPVGIVSLSDILAYLLGTEVSKNVT
ncbi:hypothetical protein SARC_11405, partial [Sphaeroforma arctica JP610]